MKINFRFFIIGLVSMLTIFSMNSIYALNDNPVVRTAAGDAFQLTGITFDEDDSGYTSLSRGVEDLTPYFSDLDIDDALVFTVVGNSNPCVVKLNIDPSNPGDLEIWSIGNEYGSADITIRATDTADPAENISSVDMLFTITVNSDNDAPLNVPDSYDGNLDALSSGSLTVDEDSGDLIIQLDSAFSDLDQSQGCNPVIDTLSYTITIDETPDLYVTSPVFVIDNTDPEVTSQTQPTAGTRRSVIETSDAFITLPLEADAHGVVDITIRATDRGMTTLSYVNIPLSAEESFTITVQGIGDDTPIANDDHYSTRPDLIIDEDSGPIVFSVIDNDYAGDVPAGVINAGQEITDAFGDHSWRSSSRMADVFNSGSDSVEINGEVSCSHDGCQLAQTLDTTIDGSTLTTGQLVYRPRLNFNGEDTFIYCIADSAPAGETPGTFTVDPSDPRCAEVTVLVNPVNDLPEPQNPVSFTMDQADDLIVPVEEGLRLQVFDVDNTHLDGLGCDPLDPGCTPSAPLPDTLYFFISSALTDHGNLLLPFATDGSFTYRPNATFFGTDSFKFHVCEDSVLDADKCVMDVVANIVIESISGAPAGSSEEVVEFDFNLAETPLELPIGPESNVLIINDDSGSMHWDILTDQSLGVYFFPSSGNYIRYVMKATAGSRTDVAPSETTAPGVGLWRLRNSIFNTVYYNPDLRYEPWEGLNSDEVEFPESTPTAARHNPLFSSPATNIRLPQDYTGKAFITTPQTCAWTCAWYSWWWGGCVSWKNVCTGGSGFQQINEEDYYIPRYYAWYDLDSSGTLNVTPSPANEPAICDTAGERTQANGCSEGVLVEIRPLVEGGADFYPKAEGRTDCIISASTCTYAEELQNFANWFTYSRNREFTAKSALGKVVAAAENIRVGYAKLNSSSNTRTIRSMNTSERTGEKAALLNAIYQTNSSGGTPLRRALRGAGRHFECRSSDIFGSGSNTAPGNSACPILAAPDGNCQQNYSLLISDGTWNGGSPSLGDPDDDNNTNFDGGVYAGSTNNTLADVAMYYYERDLHSTLGNEVPTSARDKAGASEIAFENGENEVMHQHMKTFTVGFGVVGAINQATIPTNYTQSFNWGNPNSSAGKIDDMIHAATNGRGDYLSAGDADALSQALIAAFDEFAQGSGAASAVSFNSQEIREDTLIFRSFYNTKTNTGDLVAQPISEDGSVGEAVWKSAVQMDLVDHDDREIMTWNPDTAEGMAFRPTTLTTAQKSVFVDSPPYTGTAQQILEVGQRVNYLRGDNSEERPVGNFRERPVTEGRLGDIVHSAPTFIGGPRALGRDAEPFPQGSNLYSSFRSAHVDRQDVVYTGANDGMLHGFNADDGSEIFGFIPSNLMLSPYSRRITELLNFEYTHKFFIDVTPAVNDVFMDRDGNGSEEWTTILIGGHGAGAKAYFALDITDPTKLTEATASDVVLWEFTDEDDTYPTDESGPLTTGAPPVPREDLQSPAQPVKDLGYTFGVPTLVMSNLTGEGPTGTDHKWVAVTGNGYNSTSGIAKLFVLFLDGGSDGVWCHPDMKHTPILNGPMPSDCIGQQDFVKLDTGFGVSNGLPNGLGEVRVIDVDANGTGDYAYAGDLYGNFFRFDISSSNFEDWNVTKIFKAEYDDGSNIFDQPITQQPIAIIHPTEDAGFIIIFATGAYLRAGDSTDASINSIYGIWDRLSPELIDKGTDLVEQEYTNLIDELGRVRTLSSNDVDYTGSGGKKGWYIDLNPPVAGQAPGSPAEFPGEKAIRNMQLRGGLAFVNSVFPRPANSCVGQAGGATLAFCPDTGGSKCTVNRPVFDLDNDGYFNEMDDVGPDDDLTALGRILEDPAPPTDATFIGDKRVTQFGKDLDIVGTNTSSGDNTGRLSWKRLESLD